VRVLIIGAGIAGLATAVALERVGIAATVVERAPAARAEGTALTLSFNALVAADALDVGEAIRRRSMPIDEVRVADMSDRTIEVIRLASPDGEPRRTYALRRADLLDVVEGAWRGSVDYGRTVTSVEATTAGAKVGFADRRTGRFDLVVAADGAHSRARQRLFPGSEAYVAGDRCWRFVAPDRRAHREVVEYLGPSRRLGLIPLPHGEVSVFATVRGAAGQRFADLPMPAAELIAGFGPVRPEPLVWLPWPLLARDCVGFVGDAAHVMTPNLAQGAALAMEDAVVLAGCLARAGAVPDALADYARRRRARLVAINAGSLVAGSIAHLANPLARAARDRILTTATPSGPTLSRLLDWSPDPPITLAR
jgi:2-polyprenyl-6-methoxyphenol hydroxylase-like FAD-dependent oxidoreductase